MAPSSLLERRKASRLALALKVEPEAAAVSKGPHFADEFSLGSLLGSGSMASVYLIRRKADGQAFAGKRTSSSDEEVRHCLRAEHGLLSSLHHENIVQVHGMHQDGPGDLWLSVELCEDGSVQDYVERNGAFQESAALALFAQLLKGVDFLHSKRVVHRDLKPQNLLLRESGTKLKIADFNSAKQLQSGGKQNAMLSQRSTPLYCAPEMRQGRVWNERIDIWTAGLCAFFMMKAHLPFNEKTLVRLGTESTAKLPIAWGTTSEPAQNLVEKCLILDVRMRPSAMELLDHAALCVDQETRSLCDRPPAGTRKRARSCELPTQRSGRVSGPH